MTGRRRWRPGWRLRWRLLFGLGLLAATAGHLAWHYLPRERPGLPRSGDLPGELLARGLYDVRLWLPFPHQNLGALAGTVEDPQEYLAAAARAAQAPPPALASFGPFPAPPARELTLAADLDGERFAAAARVFPLISGLSRLAGALAGNPWLAGGEVDLGAGKARVRWEGSLWIVEGAVEGGGAGIELAPVASREPPAGPALARLVLARRLAALPPGAYRFGRAPRGFALSGEGRGAEAGRGRDLGAATAVVFAAGDGEAGGGEAGGGEAGSGEAGGGRGARAAALFGEGIEGLPQAAVFFRPGGERWRLPGEGLLSLLGKDPASEQAGGWALVAYDEKGLRAGRSLLGALPAADGEGESGGLAYGLWLSPRPARRTVEGVATLLEAIPIAGKRRAGPWRDWATLLRPLERFDRLSVEVGRNPGDVQLLLVDAEGAAID